MVCSDEGTHTHARTHARTHAHAHARTRAHTHTHTHTHTQRGSCDVTPEPAILFPAMKAEVSLERARLL